MAALREQVAGLLREKKYETVLELARKDRRTVRIMMGLLYHDEELVRWRTVTMFGHLAAAEPGMVRPFIVRLLWSLSEESSIVGWGSAQALGEIARRNPGISKEAVRVVVHYPDDEELSQPANRNTYMLTGAIWATGNLADEEPALTREMGPLLIRFLDDPDPGVRAHSAWALGRIGYAGGQVGIKCLLNDEEPATIYIGDELVEMKVKDAAAGALEDLKVKGL